MLGWVGAGGGGAGGERVGKSGLSFEHGTVDGFGNGVSGRLGPCPWAAVYTPAHIIIS